MIKMLKTFHPRIAKIILCFGCLKVKSFVPEEVRKIQGGRGLEILYLVRHGQTEWNSTGKYRGHIDVPLSEHGLAQAERTGLALREEVGRGVPIFSSPLSRSAETAAIVAKHNGGTVTTVGDLTDVNFGDWQGKTREQIREEYADSFDLYHNRPELVLFPQGESLVDCAARSFRAFDELARTRGEERGVIVTHRVVLKLVILLCVGLEVSSFWKVKLDTCSISTVEFDGQKYILSGLNRNGHLRDINASTEGTRQDF
jgi:broad specificity phosphatase PhoE